MSDEHNFDDDGDFFEDEYVPTVNRWKFIGAGLAVLIVAGFGIGIWYAYDKGVKKGVQLAPPIIKADTSPVKKKPEEPGGMDIPHQDKKVFNVLDKDKPEEKVEKLMKAPEEAVKEPAPVDIAEPKAVQEKAEGSAENLMAKEAAKTEEVVKEKVEETAKQVEEKAAEVAKAVPEKKEDVKAVAEKVISKETAPEPKVTPKVEEPKTPAKEVAKKVEAPKAAVVQKSVTSGPAYRVQLGAFRSTDAAEKAWLGLQRKHSELLQGLPHKIQSVEIAGKGVFYRLQAGGFEKKEDASILCSNLKKAKQDCLVAKS